MTIPEGTYYRNWGGWAPEIRLNKAELWNERIEQDASGVTFTSRNGVKIIGTYTW